MSISDSSISSSSIAGGQAGGQAAPSYPTITMSPPVVVVDFGTNYVDTNVSANDSIDGDLTGSINTVGMPIDTNTVGVNKITYDVTNSGGKTATVSRYVHVRPTFVASPQISLPIDPADNKRRALSQFLNNQPNQFSFNSLIGVPSGITAASSAEQITGGYGSMTATVTGGEMSISADQVNWSTWATSGTINSNEYIMLRGVSPATVSLDINGVTADFVITT